MPELCHTLEPHAETRDSSACGLVEALTLASCCGAMGRGATKASSARQTDEGMGRAPYHREPRGGGAAIGELTVEGLAGLILKCGGIEATFVPEAGMVGCSLRHRGEELLGQRGGLRAYATTGGTMGIPLLYPWANRVARMRFSVAGREVILDRDLLRLALDPNGLPIHGLLAAASGWQVERHEASDDRAVLAATFDFAVHEELMAAFPAQPAVRGRPDCKHLDD